MSVIRYILRNKGPEGVTRRLLCDAFGVCGIAAANQGKLAKAKFLCWASYLFHAKHQEKGGAE